MTLPYQLVEEFGPEAPGPNYPTSRQSPGISSAYQLADGRWELGSQFHGAMVKSAPTLVGKLPTTATYEELKAWSSAVDDWVHSHIQAYPDSLAPTAVR